MAPMASVKGPQVPISWG